MAVAVGTLKAKGLTPSLDLLVEATDREEVLPVQAHHPKPGLAPESSVLHLAGDRDVILVEREDCRVVHRPATHRIRTAPMNELLVEGPGGNIEPRVIQLQ